MLSLLTRHGRGTPLLWLLVDKVTLKEQRNAYEDRVLLRLKELLPEGIGTIVADRGFGDQKRYHLLEHELHFDYVIRFRGNLYVTDAGGERRQAHEWVGQGGRARTLRGASVTADQYHVGTVVCVQQPGMKEPWCLAASTTTDSARTLMNSYAKRWGIEAGFRDTKDLRFGMGMGSTHISSPERRDRLWLLNAFAVVLLSLLGAAGEALGYDRHLKANTMSWVFRLIVCGLKNACRAVNPHWAREEHIPVHGKPREVPLPDRRRHIGIYRIHRFIVRPACRSDRTRRRR